MREGQGDGKVEEGGAGLEGKGQSGTSTLPLEYLSSEQIWRSRSGEANPFLANIGFQTQAGWLPLLA